MYINVLDGTTGAEALDLWCDVAVPAGIEQLRPEQSGVWTGFETRADGVALGGTRLLPMESSCLGGMRPPGA